MKKFLAFAAFLIALTLGNSNSAQAQWTLGGGLYYFNDAGVGVSIYKNTEDVYKNTRGGGDIVYYFSGVYEISANMHYFFLNKETYNAYALVGTTLLGGGSAFVSGILNIGAGGEYGVSFGKVFVEARYLIYNDAALGLNAGVRINL